MNKKTLPGHGSLECHGSWGTAITDSVSFGSRLWKKIVLADSWDKTPTFLRVKATGNVSGANYVGGLMGLDGWFTASQSLALGNVSGVNYVGGFAGVMGVHSGNPISMSDSYSHGNVVGTGDFIGGFWGLIPDYFAPTATRCYSTGAVTAPVSATRKGGFIGYQGYGTSMTNVTNNFWDKTTSGLTTSEGGYWCLRQNHRSKCKPRRHSRALAGISRGEREVGKCPPAEVIPYSTGRRLETHSFLEEIFNHCHALVEVIRD